MESYRHESTEKYCAVIYMKDSTGELGLCYNIHDEKFIRNYWKHNEKGYTILEIKPIKNITALHYFQYWELLPKAYKTGNQKRKKFDFYKYVLGADLSLKYRDKEFIEEVNESEVA